VYSSTEQFIPQEGAVAFEHNNAVFGSIGHILGDSNIYVWQPGYYHIYTNLYHIESCQFSLFMNNNVVTGCTIGSPTGSSQNSTCLILQVKEEDIIIPVPTGIPSPSGLAAQLTLLNHTSFVTIVTLNGSGGSGIAPNQVTATLTIFLLN
jgi:hypothetical protein